MDICVIGAGFAGLAVSVELKKRGYSVHLFDRNGIGGGASGIAAGMLHPFTGEKGQLNQMGLEGMAASQKLIKMSEKALGRSVILAKGILRIPANSRQEKAFRKSHENDPNLTEWRDGLYIPDGLVINCRDYLEGLFLASGAKLIHAIPDLPTVYCCGAWIQELAPEVEIQQIKGQVLRIEIDSPATPLNSKGYLAPDQDGWIAGATFEKEFADEDSDIELAKKEIFSKLRPIYPPIEDAKVLECRASLRAATKDRLPIYGQISPRAFVLTGLGSKGLLYHALYAKKLASGMV